MCPVQYPAERETMQFGGRLEGLEATGSDMVTTVNYHSSGSL